MKDKTMILKRSKEITKWKMLPRIDDHDKDTSSSISMYDIDSNDEGTEFISSQTPSIVIKSTPPPMNDEEINISPITEKNYSKRHFLIEVVIDVKGQAGQAKPLHGIM
jgi:hypothetical protein